MNADLRFLRSSAAKSFVMKFTVIISTHNRAESLRATLASQAKLQTKEDWELIVVDNNSTDNTRAVVEEAAKTFPVELRYLFEAEQGKFAALNQASNASTAISWAEEFYRYGAARARNGFLTDPDYTGPLSHCSTSARSRASLAVTEHHGRWA
jgi:hypothetical protein